MFSKYRSYPAIDALESSIRELVEFVVRRIGGTPEAFLKSVTYRPSGGDGSEDSERQLSKDRSKYFGNGRGSLPTHAMPRYVFNAIHATLGDTRDVQTKSPVLGADQLSRLREVYDRYVDFIQNTPGIFWPSLQQARKIISEAIDEQITYEPSAIGSALTKYVYEPLDDAKWNEAIRRAQAFWIVARSSNTSVSIGRTEIAEGNAKLLALSILAYTYFRCGERTAHELALKDLQKVGQSVNPVFAAVTALNASCYYSPRSPEIFKALQLAGEKPEAIFPFYPIGRGNIVQNAIGNHIARQVHLRKRKGLMTTPSPDLLHRSPVELITEAFDTFQSEPHSAVSAARRAAKGFIAEGNHEAAQQWIDAATGLLARTPSSMLTAKLIIEEVECHLALDVALRRRQSDAFADAIGKTYIVAGKKADIGDTTGADKLRSSARAAQSSFVANARAN